MAGYRRRRNSEADGCAFLILVGIVISAFSAMVKFIKDNAIPLIIISGSVAVACITCIVIVKIFNSQRRRLLDKILESLHLDNIDELLPKYDERVNVKSRQALTNYSDVKFLKDNDTFERVKNISSYRKIIRSSLTDFLTSNSFQNKLHYGYVENQLQEYVQLADGYRILVTYITPAGNNKGEKVININSSRIDMLIENPAELMTKSEYNQYLKQHSKEKLDSKKRVLYDHVNSIIDEANNAKDKLVVKSRVKALDELVQNLFDRTVNSIERIKRLDSDEWGILTNYIGTIDLNIQKLISEDKRISDYYDSEDFARLKETCDKLTQSQRDFNEYINEKAQSISKLLGARIVRTETQNNDVYNYIRTYKKSINPYTAEVSAAVFGSAENDPIPYILKYFYTDKKQYNNQINRLRVLIEELETLREAKEIIENYKTEYDEYIQNVPDYILSEDEDGFYSRLGLAIIDESILNVEYRFVYTSNGGMAQRSFSVPMNEENITELINQLENKLSMRSLINEQRALMTTKLRNHIKERDNYTCCLCGNSTYSEPNLLLEIDHIIPISKGGHTQEDNLQTLCWKCNRSKGAKLI